MAIAQEFKVRDMRDVNYFKIDNEIIDVYGAKIGVNGVAVYALLARFANKDTQNAWPSFQSIALKLNLSKSSVLRTLRNLELLGLISKEHNKYKREGVAYHSNTYTLLNVKPSVTQTPPSVTQTPPSVTETPPSVTQTPEQYLSTKPSNKTYQKPSFATSQATPQERVSPATKPDAVEDTEVWASLVANFGGEPRTQRERKRWRIAAQQLVTANYTADEVRRAYVQFHMIWPRGTPTPLGLTGVMTELLDNRSGTEKVLHNPTPPSRPPTEMTPEEEEIEVRRIADEVIRKAQARGQSSSNSEAS